jgi:glycosyltransferase involved in cell wall biosynthesis
VGNRDVVRDGVDGILVPPEDPDALARGLVSILTNRETAARLAAAARVSVAARYSVASMLERTLRVYRSALGGGRQEAGS